LPFNASCQALFSLLAATLYHFLSSSVSLSSRSNAFEPHKPMRGSTRPLDSLEHQTTLKLICCLRCAVGRPGRRALEGCSPSPASPVQQRPQAGVRFQARVLGGFGSSPSMPIWPQPDGLQNKHWIAALGLEHTVGFPRCPTAGRKTDGRLEPSNAITKHPSVSPGSLHTQVHYKLYIGFYLQKILS
jgi:hypothetical protein